MAVSLRGKGRAQARRQHSQLPYLFPLYHATKLGVFHHPHLGDDFADQLSMAEESNHRTLGNYDAYGIRRSAHIGGGDVTASKSQRNFHLGSHCIEITARGKNNPAVTHHESAI